MNNANFSSIDDNEKAKGLIDVLNKRCRGFIKPEVLSSIISRLDLGKQMKIDVVNEDVMKVQAKTRSEMVVSHGKKLNMNTRWARCILGSIEFGSDVVVIEDGEEIIINQTPTSIIQTPLIVQLEEQSACDLDSVSTRLLVLI